MSDDATNKMIQERFDSREFEVNQDNWNKLIPELEKLEKKKKRRAFLYFIIPGILLFLTFIVFLNYKENEVIAENSAMNKKKHKETATEKKKVQAPSESENQYPVKSSEQKEVKDEVKKPVPSNNAASINTPEESLSEKNSVSPEPLKTSDPDHTIYTQGNSEVSISKTKKQKSPVKSNHKIQDSKTNENANEHLNTESNNESPSLLVTVSENKSNTFTNPVVTPESISTDSLKPSSDSSLIALQKNDSVPPMIKDSLSNKKDSLDKKKPGLEIFTSAYLVFTPGYQSPLNFKDAFNPSAGIGIRKYFSPEIGIGTGIYYTIYSNISIDPKLFQSTTQDFGYTATFTEITQKRLHYLKAPLTLELKLNKNNFSIGAEFMYLLTSSSQIRTYNEAFGTITEISSKKEYGYINGFNNYDVGAVIMYSRRLGRKLSLSALVNMGFIDVKNNTYFNSGAFDRNKSLQIGMSYQLN